MPYKLVKLYANHMQIISYNLILLASENKMYILWHMKCREFQKVPMNFKSVNLVPMSQVHIHSNG